MRIAFFSETFLPKIDGVVVSILNLSAELGKRGHSVAIFCPSPARSRRIVWSAPNVTIIPVVSVPSLIYPDFRFGAPTPRSFLKLRNFKPQIVHLHSPGSIGVEGLVGAGILRLPLVGTFHTYFMEPEYLRLVKLEKYEWVSSVLWRYVVRFYNRCDVIVCPSKQAVQDLKIREIKKPIKLISNGIDLSFTRSVKPEAVNILRERYGLENKVILYVGRLSKEKCLDVLLGAFVKVSRKIPEAQLFLVGDGPFREQLEQQAREQGVDKRVVFAGQVEHEVLLRSGYFQATAVFCTSSTSETQGLSVLEAMAAGLPIVGVAARGVKDLVRGNGVLVKPNDSGILGEELAKILASESKMERYARRSEKLAKRYSIEKVGNDIERLYNSLLV